MFAFQVQLSDTASHSGVSELGATRGGSPPDRATSAALLKFWVGGVDASRVQLATLRLHVQSSGAVDSTVHVMHVGNSARWNQVQPVGSHVACARCNVAVFDRFAEPN